MTVNPRTSSLYYILGPTYHGATTLSARANLHPQVLSLGTGNPQRGVGQICSCGEDVLSSCPFWTKVAEIVGVDSPFPTLLPQNPYLLSQPVLNKWFSGILALAANEIGPKCWKMFYEQAERFYSIHDKFHAHAQEWSAHKVFLDAERSSLKFMVMASMDFPVKGVIHLVRDPRGYAAAWKKYYPESTAEKLALEWSAAHTRIRRLESVYTRVRFLTLKYEDLMEQPDQTLTQVFDFMELKDAEGEPASPNPLKNHLLGLGPQDLTPGVAQNAENWRETLHLEDQQRVVRAAGPLFSELGYKT